MYYDPDAFIKNIIEHSDRISAIIEATDFSNHSLNPNIILIPSLWNNVNDALVSWAMDTHAAYEEECRRNAIVILRKAGKLNSDSEGWLASMKTLRAVYTSDFPEMEFNQNDCMVFLNAYDNFMYFFYSSSPKVQRALSELKVDYKRICSMRETFLKNIHAPAEEIAKVSPASIVEETAPEVNEESITELLKTLISETRKTNELLTKLLTK